MEAAAEWKEGDADVDADAGFQCWKSNTGPCARQAKYSAAQWHC